MSATELYPQATALTTASEKAPLLLRGEDMTVWRGGRKIFQNVNVELRRGCVLLLTGPNGCGKTSLLRALVGALPAASGDVTRHTPRSPAFMPADDMLWQGSETVSVALRFWADLSGGNAASALAQTGLAGLSDRPLNQLSTGQKRRLSLARLLVQPADIWLLDEPLVGLDTAGRQMLAAVLMAHLQAGGAAVIASHEALPSLAGVEITTLALASTP